MENVCAQRPDALQPTVLPWY